MPLVFTFMLFFLMFLFVMSLFSMLLGEHVVGISQAVVNAVKQPTTYVVASFDGENIGFGR